MSVCYRCEKTGHFARSLLLYDWLYVTLLHLLFFTKLIRECPESGNSGSVCYRCSVIVDSLLWRSFVTTHAIQLYFKSLNIFTFSAYPSPQTPLLSLKVKESFKKPFRQHWSQFDLPDYMGYPIFLLVLTVYFHPSDMYISLKRNITLGATKPAILPENAPMGKQRRERWWGSLIERRALCNSRQY